MKNLYVLAALWLILPTVMAQQAKPCYDAEAIEHWYEIKSGDLTNDGLYAMYSVGNLPYNHNTLVIVPTSSNRKHTEKKIIDAEGQLFSADSKYVFFKVADTLCIYNLKIDKIKKIQNVSDFKIVDIDAKQKLIYKLSNHELVVLDHQTGQMLRVGKVESYLLSKNGGALFTIENIAETEWILRKVDLKTKKNHVIWRGKDTLDNLVIDSGGAVLLLDCEKRDLIC